MKSHLLKTQQPHFQNIKDGIKLFEIRLNDRDFEVGDELALMEYDKETDKVTGEGLCVRVTHMTDFAQQDGYVVMGITNPNTFGTVNYKRFIQGEAIMAEPVCAEATRFMDEVDKDPRRVFMGISSGGQNAGENTIVVFYKELI